jgi:hypothetical protein
MLLSKLWRAAPLYRQESFSLWERLLGSIVAAGKPLPQKKPNLIESASGKGLSVPYAFRLFAAAVVFMIFALSGANTIAASEPKGFATPEEAVQAFVAAMKSNDQNQLLAIFGPAEKELISSGDPFRDKQRLEKFVGDYERKNSLKQEGAKMVLIIGDRDWPFPIPLVKKGDQWFFDTKAGKEEILNRRVGENELSTVQTLLAIVDAQREYAMKDRDGDGIREYAEKFGSDPGKKNGLYWETVPKAIGGAVRNKTAYPFTAIFSGS